MSQPGLTLLQGAIFVQPGGPNSDVQYLGACHQLTSVSWDEGANTLHHCGDPVQPNRFQVSRKIKGPPGLVTFNIESDVQAVISYIQRFRCPAPVIVTNTVRAPKNDPTNWDVAWIFVNADPISRAYDNLVGKSENDLIMRTTGMEADSLIELYPVRPDRVSIAETQALRAVFACDFDLCADAGVQRQDRCDTLYAVADAVSGSASGTAGVWKFADNQWTQLDSDPFEQDEDIAAGTCFILDRFTKRILVLRGAADPSNPAECAFSDDDGATWGYANIGTVNGEYVTNGHALAALDRNHIWVGTNLGRIYFSGNGGESWTLQENAVITSAPWHWVEMIDNLNGFAGGQGDVIATTNDGGISWSQVNSTGAGDDILCGAVIDSDRAWAGTDGGEVYYTFDGGASWRQRAGWAGSGVGEVRSMAFYGDQIGYMAVEDNMGKASFYLTKSGGADWETIPTPANSGVNHLMICNPMLIYAVGDAHGGTALVYKLQPAQAG